VITPKGQGLGTSGMGCLRDGVHEGWGKTDLFSTPCPISHHFRCLVRPLGHPQPPTHLVNAACSILSALNGTGHSFLSRTRNAVIWCHSIFNRPASFDFNNSNTPTVTILHASAVREKVNTIRKERVRDGEGEGEGEGLTDRD